MFLKHYPSPKDIHNQAYGLTANTLKSVEKLFNETCTACHNFSHDSVVPELSTVTNKASKQWITRFITPQGMVDAGVNAL